MATEAPPPGISLDTPKLATKHPRPWDTAFHAYVLLSIAIALGALIWLLALVLWEGLSGVTLDFITENPSRRPEVAGFYSPIVGSIMLMFWTALVAIPLGFASAIYLEKFAPTTQAELDSWSRQIERRYRERYADGSPGFFGGLKVRWARLWAKMGPRVNQILEINISNLAAVPSIVYGLLGLALFVQIFGFQKSLFTGGLTLGLLVLPIVIVASREAVKAVPISVEQGAMALGATKWQAVRKQIFPAALPGMLTGTILALSRAIGETAPLVVFGGVLFATNEASLNPADSIDSTLWAMPLQIFFWKFDARTDFQDLAAPAIIVLLVVLLLMNLAAILIRNKFSRRW
jgi:phosphate transport system permease protein